MNIKSILAAGALAVVAAISTVGMTSAAQAETTVSIHLGGGYYDDAPFFHTPVCQWWEDCGETHFILPEHRPRYRHVERRYRHVEPRRHIEVENRVSCRSALRMVSRRGFEELRTRDCTGTSYRFSGWKHGRQYMVKVNARTGGFNAYPL